MSGYRKHNRERGVAPGGTDKRQQYSAMRIMDALSGVDEELLERCEQDRKGLHNAYPRPLWQRARAWAAVLCLAVVGAASWGGYQLSQMKMGGADSSSGNAAPFLAEAGDEAAPQEAVSGETAPAGMDAGDDMEAGQDGEQNRQSDELDLGKEMDESQTLPEKEVASQKDMDWDSIGAEGAMQGAESPEADVEACPLPPQSRKLTLAQAREDAVLGAYVPAALPEGYVFEDAFCVTEYEEANLTLCWTRGMDSIMLHLEKTENPPATVDVERPEIYDERLYEVPYGETVPKEYWQTFDNPVFAAGDFSLEIVKSRMKSYDDRGDTDTPRGNFSVLYADGVLVRFNGRGTPEEIWEMFCSIGE